jgi:hypothetical protein
MRSFVRLLPKFQNSCPELSLVTRAGFMVMTLRQSNNLPNGKVQTYQGRKSKTAEQQIQEHDCHFFFTSRRLFTKNLFLQAKQLIPHTTVTFRATV